VCGRNQGVRAKLRSQRAEPRKPTVPLQLSTGFHVVRCPVSALPPFPWGCLVCGSFLALSPRLLCSLWWTLTGQLEPQLTHTGKRQEDREQDTAEVTVQRREGGARVSEAWERAPLCVPAVLLNWLPVALSASGLWGSKEGTNEPAGNEGDAGGRMNWKSCHCELCIRSLTCALSLSPLR
jgi:hypothetical protein